MKINTSSKLLLKILSGVLAVLLWFAITYTEDPIITQHMNAIKVVLSGEDALIDNGLIVVNKDSLPNISAVIRGNRSSVISAMRSVSALIDVSSVTTAGDVIVPIKYNYPQSDVSLERSKLREITLKVEKLVSREIPLVLEVKNADKNESFFVNSSTGTNSVTIRGAESTVYKITQAKALIDVSEITMTGAQDYFFSFFDDDENQVSSDNIIYTSLNTIEVLNDVYKKATLPVRLVLSEQLKEHYVITDASLSFQTVVAGLSNDAKETELVAVLETLPNSDTAKIELPLIIPDGIAIADKYKTVTVSCKIEPKVTQSVELPIKITNLPEGKTAVLGNDKVSVTVKGAKHEILPSNLLAEIDVSALKEDEGILDIKITAPESLTVIGTYKTSVQIK